MKTTVNIFVSSKMDEMQDERHLLKTLIPGLGGDLIELNAYIFEQDETASNNSIRETYLNALGRSALYMGLFGLKYGKYTIDEFNHATKWGIDRHIYEKRVDVDKRDSELQKFLNEQSHVERGITSRWYKTLEEFEEVVRQGIEEWLIERLTRPQADTSAYLIDNVDDLRELPDYFVGRADKLHEIEDTFTSYGTVLLHGSYGMGKSALAAAFAETRLKSGMQKMLWLHAGDGSAEVLLDAIARPLEAQRFSAVQAIDARCNHVRNLLQKNAIKLVVLDNVWNGESLRSIQPAIPKGTHLLVTSRERFPDMALISVGEMAREEAIKLLQYHAHRQLYSAEQNEICEQVGDNAFAVRLAGMQMYFYGLSERELLDMLSKTSHTLEVPRRLAEEGQKSVAQLLEMSLNYLKSRGETHQQAYGFLLAMGAFFSTHVTSEMLSQYMSEQSTVTEKILNLLSQVGLVEPIPATEESIGHYRIHDLTYTVLKNKVVDQRRDQALEACLAYAQKHGRADPSHFNNLEPELPNFVGAARWGMYRRQHAFVEKFAWWLYSVDGSQFLQLRAHYRRAIEILEMAAEASRAQNKRRNEGVHILHLGQAYYNLRQYKEADEKLIIALGIGDELNNNQIRNVALGYMGHIRLEQDSYDAAYDYYQRALALALQINDIQQAASWHGSLGNVRLQQGSPIEAIDHFKAAYNIALQIGDPRNARVWKDNLNLALQRMGRASDRTEMESLDMASPDKSLGAQSLGDRRGIAQEWSAVAVAAHFDGDYQKALEHYEKVLEIAKQTQDKRKQAETHNNLGLLYSEQSQFEKAHEHINKAITIAREIGNRRLEGTGYNHSGAVASAQGDFSTARTNFEQALTIAIEIGARDDECLNVGALASLLTKQGYYDDALPQLYRGLEIAMAIGDLRKQGNFMANIAEIYTQQGQVNRALDSLEKAVEIAREVGDRPDYSDRLNALGIAQRHLKQLDASIKTFSEALAIAKEIGNERLQGTILGNRGLAFADAKQPYDAVRDVKRAVDLAQQTKDRHGEGNYLSNLGSQCMALMIHDYAFKYLEAALAIAHEIGDVKGEAMRLGNLGATAHSARRFDDAIRYSEQAREKFLTLGLNQLAKQSEDNIVKAHRDRQSVEAGGGLFDGAFDQMVANQTRTKTYSMALAALQIAEDSLQQNRIQEAAAYAIQSHKLASAVNAHDVRAKCMSFLGELQVQQRLYNEAILHFHQSAAIAHIVGEPGITVEALLKLGKVHLSRGDRFLCLHYYNEALDLAKQQNLESLIPKIEVAIKQV